MGFLKNTSDLLKKGLNFFGVKTEIKKDITGPLINFLPEKTQENSVNFLNTPKTSFSYATSKSNFNKKQDFSFSDLENNEIKKDVEEKILDSKKDGIEWASNSYYTQASENLDVGLSSYHTRGEILNKESFARAERVLRDPQVQACLGTLIFGILKKPYVIKAADNEDDSIFCKDFIDHVFSELKGSIEKSLFPILTSGCYFGYGLSEKVYKTSSDNRFKGFLILDKIKNKKPGLFSFELDVFDNISAINNLAFLEGDKKYLPVDKFLIFSYMSLFENPYGQGIFDSIEKFVYSKSQLIQQMLIANTKFASDTIGVEIPRDRIGDANAIDAAQDIAEAVQSGNAIAYEEGLKINTFGSAKGPCPYLPRLNYFDSQISLKILGNDLTNKASTSGKGTQAETKEKFKVTNIFEGYIQKDIEEIINEQIIRDLLEWNTNIPSSKFCKFKFLDNKKENQKEQSDSTKTYVDMKVLKPESRVADEVFIRQEGNLPELSDKEIELRNKKESLMITGGMI